MKFRTVHKMATYLMVCASLGALALGNNLSTPVLAVVLLATMISVFLPERREASMLWQTAWTVSTFVALGLCIVEFLLRSELVLSTVNFLLFLLVNKLYNRRTGRDYLQLYVVTFMMVVAGSVLNIGISFALLFMVYIVATTWSLILFHLRREMEENYLIKHSSDSMSERVAVDRILNSRRIVGGKFLLGTSLVSVTVFVLAVSTFLFFPRVGSQLAMGRGGRARYLTGFSDRLSLGGHGRLRDNPQIVMRVYLPNRPPTLRINTLRWRGTSFDRYAKGRWFRSDSAPVPAHARRRNMLEIYGGDRIDARSHAHRLGRALRQDVYMEPIGTDILFAASQPVGLDTKRFRGANNPKFRVAPGGELRGNLGAGGGHYVVYSDLRRPSRAALAATGNKATPPNIRAHYVRPHEPLPSGIALLARKVTAGKPHRIQKVEAVLAYLGKGFGYSRNLRTKRGRDPVAHFLLHRKKGHCEYFASAMVLMLRAVGVPARVVTGFLGGAWNSYGSYVSVRQGDAHAWTEVWFDTIGWVTFDPTPPAGRLPLAAVGWTDRMKLFFDSLRMRWHRWVIDYDVNRQVGLFQDMKGRMTRLRKRATTRLKASRSWGYVGLGVTAALLFLFWFLRRPGRHSKESDDVHGRSHRRLVRPMARLLKGLAKHGHRRERGQTIAELAARVDSASPGLEPTTSELTRQYYELRYSGAELPPGKLDNLERGVRSLLAGLAALGS
jgi:protein-glutamine gamma-glutamyltransferase